MPAEVNLDKVNEKYPCDKRTGHGKGCKCRNNGVDTRLIRCEYFRGNVRLLQCESCRYQKKYVQSINKESSE